VTNHLPLGVTRGEGSEGGELEDDAPKAEDVAGRAVLPAEDLWGEVDLVSLRLVAQLLLGLEGEAKVADL